MNTPSLLAVPVLHIFYQNQAQQLEAGLTSQIGSRPQQQHADVDCFVRRQLSPGALPLSSRQLQSGLMLLALAQLLSALRALQVSADATLYDLWSFKAMQGQTLFVCGSTAVYVAYTLGYRLYRLAAATALTSEVCSALCACAVEIDKPLG